MALSRKYLSEDEQIVYHLRTHVKEIFGPLALLLVVAAAAVIGANQLPESSSGSAGRWAVLVAATLVVAVWGFWPILKWLTTTYTVTNQRLITRSGVLTRVGRDIPHEHIHDVAYEQGVVDRVLRCGTLVVSSASEQGTVRLHDVPSVHEVQLRLSELVRESDDPKPDTSQSRSA